MDAVKGHANRRHRWFVNRTVQFPFVRIMVLTLCILIIAVLVGVYGAIRITLSMFQLQNELVRVQLFRVIGLLVTIELAVCGPLLVWGLWRAGMVWTHRIAGPLVRIHTVLARMARGDFDIQVKLRKGDLLMELAEHVQRLADFLRTRPPSPPQ